MEGGSQLLPPSTQNAPLSHSQTHSKKRGGWRAIKYILGNESFEKLASMSLVANLTVYLRTKYNLSGVFLVNTVQIWNGTTNISSIGGAIVSDVYIGRFYTLLFGTIFSLLGIASVTLTAGLPELRPPHCQDQSHCTQPRKWQLAILFAALGLIAIGAGGIRPCNIAFGADQFNTKTEKGRSQLQSFFNWWYFSFTIALVISLTGVVYIQTNISWLIGFAIPTACLAISITIFLIGCHTYVYKNTQGSVFVDMAKVIISAFRKRKVDLKSCSFYVDPERREDLMMLSEENKFKFFEKAAMITDAGEELNAQGTPKNAWRLCSLQQVEDLKRLVGILPVWVSGIGCFVVMDQQTTFGILQAIQMNRSIGKNFMIPPAWMGITSMIALSIWILIYEQIYVPNARKILKRDSKLTMKQRIRTGIIMSIICMVVAGVIERKRQSMALRHGSFVSPLHVSMLVPQFVLSGLTEAFAAVALMEFFTIQLPESMRSVAGAVFFLSLSVGSYLSSFIVNIINLITKRRGKTHWVGGHDLNKNRLEYYYYIIAGLAFVNLLYFTFFASKFVSSGKVTKKLGEVELENSGRRNLPSYASEDGERGLKTIDA